MTRTEPPFDGILHRWHDEDLPLGWYFNPGGYNGQPADYMTFVEGFRTVMAAFNWAYDQRVGGTIIEEVADSADAEILTDWAIGYYRYDILMQHDDTSPRKALITIAGDYAPSIEYIAKFAGIEISHLLLVAPERFDDGFSGEEGVMGDVEAGFLGFIYNNENPLDMDEYGEQ